MKLTAYAHVIWDWNGTLLDDAWLCVDVMNGVLRAHDLPKSLTRQDWIDLYAAAPRAVTRNRHRSDVHRDKPMC